MMSAKFRHENPLVTIGFCAKMDSNEHLFVE